MCKAPIPLAQPCCRRWWRASSAQQASAIERQAGKLPNETVITARDTQGQPVRIDIAAHGSSTGFTALVEGEADLAPPHGRSTTTKYSSCERWATCVLPLPSKSLPWMVWRSLSTPTTRCRSSAQATGASFSGQIQRWEELGISGGAIHLYARDDRSGTFETFKALVLAPQHAALSAQARRFESSDELAAGVSTDRQAIGFSSLAAIHGAKVLAVAEGDAPAMLPARALVASEDYPCHGACTSICRPTPNHPPKPWRTSPKARQARPSSPSKGSFRSRYRPCQCHHRQACRRATATWPGRHNG